MKKKAELLQTALKMMKRQLKGGGVELPTGEVVVIDLDEARALAEALESLRWVAVYESDERNEIGMEYVEFEDADYIGRLAEGVDYLETVGIIRLKDENDEN
jgi:hypothetical protein